MTSQSKNNRLLPLTVIEAAAGGDVEAINAVLKHYPARDPRRLLNGSNSSKS